MPVEVVACWAVETFRDKGKSTLLIQAGCYLSSSKSLYMIAERSPQKGTCMPYAEHLIALRYTTDVIINCIQYLKMSLEDDI